MIYVLYCKFFKPQAATLARANPSVFLKGKWLIAREAQRELIFAAGLAGEKLWWLLVTRNGNVSKIYGSSWKSSKCLSNHQFFGL